MYVQQPSVLHTIFLAHASLEASGFTWHAFITVNCISDRPPSACPSSAVSVATTSAADPSTQQAAPLTSSAAQPAAGSFNWSKAWYPVCVASQLDKEKPQSFTLLGQPLVIWWEATSSR
jgi:hypothetical protein